MPRGPVTIGEIAKRGGRLRQIPLIKVSIRSLTRHAAKAHSITSSVRASSIRGIFQVERLRGPEVDNQLEFVRQFDRQVGSTISPFSRRTCKDW